MTEGGGGSGSSGGKPAPNGGGGVVTVPGGIGGSENVAGHDTGGAPVDVGESVLQRSGDSARSAHYTRTRLTHETVGKFFFDVAFDAAFSGEVVASPLYLERGPGSRPTVFVATTANDVYAIDAELGTTVWHKQLGSAPPAGSVPCAGAESYGVQGTPIIDAQSATLYVAAAVGQATLERHEIHALGIHDGEEHAGFPLNVASLAPGFIATDQHQWGALSLLDGYLLVAYGGAPGCAQHRGWVVAINTKAPGEVSRWSSRSAGAGIDAAGGLAVGDMSAFAATGPAVKGASSIDDSQQLLRLTTAAFTTGAAPEAFVAPQRQALNQSGASLGANNPLLIDVPGSTPSRWVARLRIAGHLILRDPLQLGVPTGGVQWMVPGGPEVEIRTVPTAYHTAKGTYLAFTAAKGVTCPDGAAPSGAQSGETIVAVRFSGGATPQPQVAWCYRLVYGAQGAPISTSASEDGDATVWFMDDIQNRKLLAVDGDTGSVLFDGGHDVSTVPVQKRTCPGVANGASPILVGSRLMIAGKDRLCAWCAVTAPGGACLP